MPMYEIWSNICSHQVTGLMYHFQFADMFYFLGFDNLGKNQECHYYEESKSLRENHCFILNHHNKIAIHKHAEGVDLIPNAWSKYTMNEVDKSTRKNQVAGIFETWMKWEIQTKELYTEMYTKATEHNAIVDACRIKEMIFGVEEELIYINKCINKLKMCEYSNEAILSL